ncbi:acyl-CoA N-acyltransferase [Piromyces finnis]|uniref:Acyl-CoA N-acyltransferase n=1 Tax=Piromyces finnis TaxID=1754191 RepID=A0A1Y1V438_9FUNG|nr:acyl-CoA N-acyltransferase [Piromyces finnis]|eukprot:ORX46848.1 acyl-CoA N-acyltransferase [Piromyces finnis]
MNIEIREEKPEDYFETEEMVRRSFYNVYNPGCTEHLLVHIMRKHEDFLPELSKIALVDGKVAGLIMYYKSYIQTNDKTLTIASFGPLCVDHKYKNMGIGSRLLNETIPLVKEAGFRGIMIFGEPNYYPKFGFKSAREFGLTDMEGNAFDALMGMELVENGLHIEGGKFKETDAINLCTEEALLELENASNYENLKKVSRPCQWSYMNASDKKEGYHYEYATHYPTIFENLFKKYNTDNTREELLHIWKSIDITPYVLFNEKNPIGIMVISVEEEKPQIKHIFLDIPDDLSISYKEEITKNFMELNK